MTSFLLLGLYSWILIGLVAGGLGAKFLPGRPALGVFPALLVGVLGALVGGLLASVLDFGGLAVYDLRSFAVATLSALIALTVWRMANLAT